MTYPKSPDDAERVEKLRSLGILDSAPDENFDRIVRLCRQIFDVEIATVSMVDEDRQWFKAVEGLGVCEIDRDAAFCNHTILGDAIFEVPDALADPQFATNPLVTGPPGIRYYAGAPIRFDDFALGALCLIDPSPRPPMGQRQREILGGLAGIVEREIRTQRILRESVSFLTGFSDIGQRIF